MPSVPLPVSDDSDVLAVFPVEYKQQDSAPVRDALVAGQVALHAAYQPASATAAAQCDVGRATDQYLDGLAEDRGLNRASAESNSSLRARTLPIPTLVTQTAIIAAVNAGLSRFTSDECQAIESIGDRACLRDTTTTSTFATFLGGSPNYPDRLYPEDAAVNGGFRPNSSPGGGWLFGDQVGRYFVIRVPDLSPLDTAIPVCWDTTRNDPARALGTGSLFIGDGTAQGVDYLNADSSTALDAYKSIANTVAAIAGHSVRWVMISDPSLNL